MGKNCMRLSFASKKISRMFHVEYYMLDDPQSEGDIIGYFDGMPISNTVIDRTGKLYQFAGVVPRRSDGRLDVQTLRYGEWVVEPGLIYLLGKSAKAGGM